MPTNKVIYFESVRFHSIPTNIIGEIFFRTESGQEVSMSKANMTTYLSGPGELIVPRGAWVRFTILDNIGIQTKYLGAKSNIVVNLEAGKSIRWFRPYSATLDYDVTLTDADQRFVSFRAGLSKTPDLS